MEPPVCSKYLPRFQNCSCSYFFAEDGVTRQLPCHRQLDGFVCLYEVEDLCSPVQVGADAQVKYHTPMGVEGDDWATFPAGTIAVKESGEYPAWKRICFSGIWKKAPWNCEVLDGGCTHLCVTDHQTHKCTCPDGHFLHPNNFTCANHPCAHCAQGCQQRGSEHVCTCRDHYVLAQDGKTCVYVDECAAGDMCPGEGYKCVNTLGGFTCICKEGFVEEDGECVDVSICHMCEQMKCVKENRKYRCACRDGFRVSRDDPTKCDIHCTQQDCPAKCVLIPNPELESKEQHLCLCPDGYIKDMRNGTPICTDINECDNELQCDHVCQNLFGGYKCLCHEGFELHDGHSCVSTEEDDDGSGSVGAPGGPTEGARLAAVPPYVKTGSALGITAFLVVCVVLLYFLVRNLLKRCGKMQFYSLTRPNTDIFYLQQVTTEKYKRLSFDKQSKSDSQRL
ncbi:thrombomodulin-like [Thalassophryne amazonica]|uniref:thrombomodulin-like n=1 Tax=Thalassophryne amazonica TaxID=390379 RepID=UPI001471AA28|nr:thrombomodulin-like [Thalassophryne amazonica]